MKATQNPSLRSLNSFGLDARAALLLEIETEEDLLNAPAFNPRLDLVLGGGSNVVFASNVPGNVFLNRIAGIDIVGESDDDCLVEVGAGENWHRLVRWSLQEGLSGLENLSLIPGSAGAAPIQNIGAYGVELESVIEQVSCWDWQRACWAVFKREECRFGYRDSRFKTVEADRYLVTSIRLRLSRTFRPQLAYQGLQEALAGRDRPTALDVSNAIIEIRRRKLPDPDEQGNAGSFFKNPVVGMDTAEELRMRFPALPTWPQDNDRCKLSAAWMIEQCGLKGSRCGAAAVSKQHALVLVNLGSASGSDVLGLASRIQDTVATEFGIQLEPEPRILQFA